MAESSKKTKGKQKITIKRIENDNDRMVTFSKRKSGIYKKADELVTLTGCKVGVLVFSPTGKPYTFGYPSFESISNRFMGVNLAPNYDSIYSPIIEANRQANIDKLNHYHNDLICQLDSEKEHGETLKEMEMTKGKRNEGWWQTSIEKLDMEGLHQLDTKFESLGKDVHRKLNEKSLG